MKIKRLLIVVCVVVLALVLVPVGVFFALQADPPVGPVTPTAETPLDTGWKPVELTRGLEHPWGADWLPDGAGMLITERPGRVRLFVDGALRPDDIAGVPAVFAVGQGGLLDIALHPDFATNRLVYLTAATGTEEANRTTLFRAVLNDEFTAFKDLEEIYRVSRDKSGSQHFGSVIEWLPDGSLLLSIGDGGNPPISLDGEAIRRQAQNRETAFGAVLRMLDDGTPHPENPFAGGAGDEPYIYTFGHRNVQGLALRPGTDEVWATEHGSKGGDELNMLEPGADYAWPDATYSVEYWGLAIADAATKPGARDPHVVWTPALAPCGLVFYTGDDFPDWKGDLLASGLVSQQIRRLHFNDAGTIEGHTTLQFAERMRWVGVGPDGGLFALTDAPDGALLRIDPE